METTKIQEQIRAALKDRNIASLALAVARDGEIIWEAGFGWANRETRLRSDPHITYSLASISKPITATGCSPIRSPTSTGVNTMLSTICPIPNTSTTHSSTVHSWNCT